MEHLHPDVLLLDLMMPGMGGIDVLRDMVGRRLKTNVVIRIASGADTGP